MRSSKTLSLQRYWGCCSWLSLRKPPVGNHCFKPFVQLLCCSLCRLHNYHAHFKYIWTVLRAGTGVTELLLITVSKKFAIATENYKVDKSMLLCES